MFHPSDALDVLACPDFSPSWEVKSAGVFYRQNMRRRHIRPSEFNPQKCPLSTDFGPLKTPASVRER